MIHFLFWNYIAFLDRNILSSSPNSLLVPNERNSHPPNVESQMVRKHINKLCYSFHGKIIFLLSLQRIRAHNSTQDFTMKSPFIWPNQTKLQFFFENLEYILFNRGLLFFPLKTHNTPNRQIYTGNSTFHEMYTYTTPYTTKL